MSEQSIDGSALALRSARRAGALALMAACCAGCSPVTFALREREAAQALRAAEQTEARSLSRYELTLARLYLAKARELASEAHYAYALDLADRSERSARRASTLTLLRGGSRAASAPSARAPEADAR